MKRVGLILVSLLLFAALPATIFLVMRNQEIRNKAAPATTLSLNPATVSKAVGEDFTLEVKMNTAANQIVAVELNLTFDPTKLQAEWIHNGTMFPNILSSGTVGNGTLSMAVGATNTTTPITGTGTVATIKFKALAATSSPVSVRFSQDTFVGALGEGNVNALTSTTPATITIGSGGSTITPTVTTTAGVTPTTTITGTPSVTPTDTPSGTGGGLDEDSDNEATSGASVKILTPDENESVTTLPKVIGTAAPGSTVTIVIHSAQEITATVVADANGNWSYVLEEALASGPHTINVAAQNPTSGETTTASLSFVVANGSENGSSGEAIPVSGAVENTLLLLSVGVLFIVIGAVVPALHKR